jgi:hypothetical protein
MNSVSCPVTRTLMEKTSSTATATVFSGTTWLTMDTSGNVYVDTSTVNTGIYLVSYVYAGITYITTDFILSVVCAPYTALTTIPSLSGVYYKNQMLNSVVPN